MDRSLFQRAKRFVYQHARPLDFARWGFHFEGADAGRVLDVLSQYQNPDGGFGHGLEADCWNPQSSPMQTWAATEIVHEVGVVGHPVVTGILKYLEGPSDFDGHTWARTIPSNNESPHAPWWSHEEGGSVPAGYNPTASLAGFALQFAEAGSPLHQRGLGVAGEAFEVLLKADSVEVHELSCFQRLLSSTRASGVEPADLGAVQKKLEHLINHEITRDTATWKTGYVCRPSRFIRSPDNPLYRENAALVDFEVSFLTETQRDDGSWSVNWNWGAYPDQWPIAQNWWRSLIVIENLLFLKNFGSR